MSSPSDRVARGFFLRSLRFWARHLLILHIVLFALVWLLYGSLELHGHGRDYYARAVDFWLERDPSRFERAPGIENVLLPGAGAVVARVLARVGVEFNEKWFAVLAVAPYPIFAFAVTWIVRRGRANGVLACAAAVAVYTSGMMPYMTSWGGYADGISYLLLVPVLLWPESLSIYAAAFVLQCLNHYLGAISLLLLAFVWHSLHALEFLPRKGAPCEQAALLDEPAKGARVGALGPTTGGRRPMHTFVLKATVSAVILGAFLLLWHTQYPEAARVRQQIAIAKWSDPEAVVREVLGPFPWTLLSALKLTIVPVAALMIAPAHGRTMRATALAMPFVAAALLTFLFVDVTRVATMLILPALLVTILVAQDQRTEPVTRRRLRRLLLITAALNLLVPNYYVNNGELHVPPPVLIRSGIEWILGE